MRRSLIILAFALFALIGVSQAPARAQILTGTNGGEAVTVPVEQLEQLKATLSDDAKRKKLLADIDALIAAGQRQSTEQDQEGGKLGRELVKAIGEAKQGLAALPPYFDQTQGDARQLVTWVSRTWRDPVRRGEAARQIGLFAGIFAVGWLVEYGLWVLVGPARRRLMNRAPGTLLVRFLHGVQRVAIELMPILGFFAAAAAFGLIGGPATALTATGLALAMIYGGVRTILACGRLLLAPNAPGLRLLPLTTPTAADLYRWLRRIVRAVAVAMFVVLASRFAGLPAAAERLVADLAVIVVAVLLIAFAFAQRRRIGEGLAQRARAIEAAKDVKLLLLALAHTVHLLIVAVIVGLTGIILLRIDGGTAFMLTGTVGTVATVIATALAIGLLARLIKRVESAASAAAPTPWSLIVPYLPVVHGLAKAVVFATAAVVLLQCWGADAFGWLSSAAGKRLIGSGASILLVLVIAVIVWQLASTAIARPLERLDGGAAASPRARTLLPLLRKVLFIVLAFIVGMVVLSELGVAIAPLLAGAGIIGLAVGFGAQKLVQDVITGIFILIEDAVAIGDVVTVAGIGGLVEDLSIRSIRLRDLSGNVHTIPFSSVDTVTNMTKVFSYYLLDIGVAYREDTDEVAEVCRRIVEDMRADPEFAPHILEPLEILGVDQFADSAVIIKARIKTVPIKQWFVGREFNRRMKKRFDELGIEIPFPHRTIYFGVDKQGAAPAASVRIDGGAAFDDPPPAMPPPTDPPQAIRPLRPDADRKG